VSDLDALRNVADPCHYFCPGVSSGAAMTFTQSRFNMRFLGRYVLLSTLAAACQTTPHPSEPPAPTATIEPAPDPNAPVSSPPLEPDQQAPGAGSDPGWRSMEPKVAVRDEWRACSDSAECTLVETACCDHCNGGTAVAVNASHAADIRAQFPRDKCSGSCTERGCFTRAACDSGRCVMQWATSSP
jgi:hypothetical protein